MNSIDQPKKIDIAPWKQQYAKLIDKHGLGISSAHLTVFLAGIILLCVGQHHQINTLKYVGTGLLVAPSMSFLIGRGFWSHIKEMQKYNTDLEQHLKRAQN